MNSRSPLQFLYVLEPKEDGWLDDVVLVLSVCASKIEIFGLNLSCIVQLERIYGQLLKSREGVSQMFQEGEKN